jgi:hypothetical protein
MQPFYCSSCGKQNAPDAKFCNECAKPMAYAPPIEPIWQPPTQIACPSCRMMNPSNYEFCHVCHKPLFYSQPVQTPLHQSLEAPPNPDSLGYKIGAWWGKQPTSTKLTILGIALFCLLSFVVIVSQNQRPKQDKASSAFTSTPAVSTPAPEETSKQKLERVKRVLESYGTIDAFEKAIVLINSIPKEAPEYKEAQSLVKPTQVRIAKLYEQAEIEKNPIRVINSKFIISGFGSVALWKVTFENRSNQRIGNLKYRTLYYAETGKQINQGGTEAILDYTIQKVFEPRSKRTIEINDGFIQKDVVKGTFELVSWETIN